MSTSGVRRRQYLAGWHRLILFVLFCSVGFIFRRAVPPALQSKCLCKLALFPRGLAV